MTSPKTHRDSSLWTFRAPHSAWRAEPARLPVVFTREEARAVLADLDGIRWVMAGFLYGSGLQLMECTRLRVKNVPCDRHQLIVRDGQGGKDRITLLPDSPSPMETEPMGPLVNGLAPVAGIYTQFAPVTYNAGRKKHHVNPRPAL